MPSTWCAPELRFELRSALNRAFELHESTLSLPILVRFNGAPHRVHLLVKPVADEAGGESHNAIVIFIEGEAVDESLLEVDSRVDVETVRRLTQELELMQARLRTVREESDSANQELRAANEELQSINEEYRSTSEELETSKEELQSINEELQTVNTELKLKLDAISRAHSDLQNLIAATDIGTLFLDSSLRIKRFTDRVTELFSITQSDEGRPITDFAHRLEYDDLVRDARAVLADLTPLRREIRSRDGRWYDLRLRPYRTGDDKIDGVVITFVDISERHVAEAAVLAGEGRQRLLLSELTHRVRNSLAVIQAIARHTFRGNQPNEEELKRFRRSTRGARRRPYFAGGIGLEGRRPRRACSPAARCLWRRKFGATAHRGRSGFAAGGSGDAVRSRAARTGEQCRQARRIVEPDRQSSGDLGCRPREQAAAHQG